MIYIKNVHGVKLTYHFDQFGWSYQVIGFKDRLERRKAIMLYPKHCPETPEHLVQSIVDENMKLLDVVRSVRTDYNK